jgi:alpha-amylase
MHRTTSPLAAGIAALAASVLVLSACAAQAPDPVVAADAPPDVGVQLFELPWNSIASECENTLGPNGFAWVLTSPPQEHVAGYQWWTSYQPVGYAIDSKLGTRADFADMVARCDAVGVQVIADAVVDHLTQQDAAGTKVAELDMSSPQVRQTIDAYLEDLLSLGVSGFRIDAADRIAIEDLEAIVAPLPDDTIIMSEVIRGGASDRGLPEEYTRIGKVVEFQYARELGSEVSSGYLGDPELADPRPSHVPSASALVFVDDHDTERGDAAVTYRDGALYLIANVLMLADEYGTPVVYSGYAFTSRDAGPPSSADGRVLPASCDGVTAPVSGLAVGERTCTHAWTAIAGMLEWRSAVGDAPRLAASKGGDLYGFERAGRGLVAVNPTGSEGWVIVPTSMPDGDYCDVITGGPDAAADGTCAGQLYSVDNGSVTFHLPAMTAAAIHLGSRIP